MPTNWLVTTVDDSATSRILGSLRFDLALASNGDTITFDPSLLIGKTNVTVVLGSKNDPSIQNVSNQIIIDKSVSIQGLGAASLAISGAGNSRVFQVQPGVQVTISGMTIENGNGTVPTFDGNPDNGLGGGILNYGTLTLTGCTVSGNSAGFVNVVGGQGGGIYNAASATLTLNNTTVTNNKARVEGGGIYNIGKLTIQNSNVTGNTADRVSADLFTQGTCTGCNSTIGISFGKIRHSKKC